MRSGAKIAVVGGAFLIVAGGVGYGGHHYLGGDGSAPAAPKKATGPLTPEEIAGASERFLTAWAAGRSSRAARRTDDPVTAQPLLAAYRDKAHVSKAVITPGKPAGTTVPFTVEATVSHQGASKPWSYSSELTVVRGKTTGRPLVAFAPSVLHPDLTSTTSLETGGAAAPPIRAVDHRGRELSREKHPSLGPLLDTLRTKYGQKAGGSPALELRLVSSAENIPDRTLLTLSKGKPGTLRTTLDADVQTAAEAAVKTYGRASAVAVRPSTGEIRAVANSPADGYNTAMMGAQAPGSTMKIVTAAMMLDKGVVQGPATPVECPPTVQWDGATFQNLDKFRIDGGTFEQSFLRSCNTAFIKAIPPLGAEAGTALGDTARKYFGIGLDWKTGAVSVDGSVPASTGTETAASYIGQGKVTMNALTMASVTATAKNGAFKQPVLVPASLDGRELATAQPLPASVARDLRAMMNATAVRGTGRAAMASISGDKGAKTGSAEVAGQGKSNSWFTGYAGDLAAASVVQSGGSGGDAAGPVVGRVLGAG